jgi:thiol:disulfide interchange protein
MRRKAFFRTLLVLVPSVLFVAPAQAQYTIHDSQIKAAVDWIAEAIVKFLCLGFGVPLLVSALTYWLLRAFYPYYTAKATLGLWLSCLVWWVGCLLAIANRNTSKWIICLLLLLIVGASVAGYSSSRKLKPEQE